MRSLGYGPFLLDTSEGEPILSLADGMAGEAPYCHLQQLATQSVEMAEASAYSDFYGMAYRSYWNRINIVGWKPEK